MFEPNPDLETVIVSEADLMPLDEIEAHLSSARSDTLTHL